jgi:hypothetical protein
MLVSSMEYLCSQSQRCTICCGYCRSSRSISWKFKLCVATTRRYPSVEIICGGEKSGLSGCIMCSSSWVEQELAWRNSISRANKKLQTGSIELSRTENIELSVCNMIMWPIWSKLNSVGQSESKVHMQRPTRSAAYFYYFKLLEALKILEGEDIQILGDMSAFLP